MAYPRNINFVNAGEPVSASVTNRPTRQLTQRTEQLRADLLASSLGEALYLKGAMVDPSVTVGTPVYWNPEENRFSPAYVSVSTKCGTGDLELEPNADCIGLVKTKHSHDSADIIIFGVADIPEIYNFLPHQTGKFFLGANPGTLTFNRPAVNTSVGIVLGPQDPCDSRVLVYVNPDCSGRVFQHIHYSHELKRNMWRAASEFDSAPEGATFGYNIALDDELKDVFPPIPLSSVACTIDWDGNTPDDEGIDETFGGRFIPVNVENCLIKVDTSGIWWMGADINPTELDRNTTVSPYRGFRITIHYSRILYGNQKSYVTSLRPDTNQPFEFVDCQGGSASTGDLYARFIMANQVVEVSDLTGRAIKRINDKWIQESIPVIHGLRASGNGVSIDGSSFTMDGKSWYNGLVTLSVNPYSADYELQPQVVRMDKALESTYRNIQYLAFPHSRESSLSMRIEVPGVFGSNLKLKMRFLCLARLAGLYPDLTLTCIRLPRPKNTAVSLNEWNYDFTMELETAVSVTANTIFEVESEEISVSEGDTLIFTISRPSSSAYASDAGIIRATGILNSGVSK